MAREGLGERGDEGGECEIFDRDYQNPGHEIDQTGACRCVYWHCAAFLWDHL